jgi:ribosomal protein S18 acetylase RimI-like enzyme
MLLPGSIILFDGVEKNEMNEAQIQESNWLFRNTWKYFASQCPRGEIHEREGLCIYWGNVDNVFFNSIFIANPIQDENDLEAKIQVACQYVREHNHPWWLVVCEDWLPGELRSHQEEIFFRHELKLLMKTTGMATDKLLPPVKIIPTLECVCIDNQETRKALSYINAVSYQMRPEQFCEPLEREKFWQKTVLGTVGYLENKPVSTAIVLCLEGKFYLALVATLPEYRNRGYAQTVIRHCLAQAEQKFGSSRTILHATAAGVPVYKRLGYQPQAYFSTYTS